MNTFHLHGRLTEFGESYELSVHSIGEAIRAMGVQLKGFLDALKEGEYRVIRGELHDDLAECWHLGEEELGLGLANSHIHIVPHVSGSGNGGIGKLLVGVALIGASFIIPGAGAGLAAAWGTSVGGLASAAGVTLGTIGLMGVGLALGGLAMMIAPTPSAPNPNDSEDTPSNFTFTGPVNLSEQGHVIPPVYGRYRMGTITVSAEIETLSIQAGYWRYFNGGSGFFGGVVGNLFPPTWVDYNDSTAYATEYDAYAIQTAQFPNWPNTRDIF